MNHLVSTDKPFGVTIMERVLMNSALMNHLVSTDEPFGVTIMENALMNHLVHQCIFHYYNKICTDEPIIIECAVDRAGTA